MTAANKNAINEARLAQLASVQGRESGSQSPVLTAEDASSILNALQATHARLESLEARISQQAEQIDALRDAIAELDQSAAGSADAASN